MKRSVWTFISGFSIVVVAAGIIIGQWEDQHPMARRSLFSQAILLAKSLAHRSDTPPDVDSLSHGVQPQGYKVGAQIQNGKATGYGYPGDPSGGGTIGYKGHVLYTPEDFFAGRSKYVTVALNPDLMNQLWPHSDTDLQNAPMLYSPALDQHYAAQLQKMGLKHLPLVAADIGPGVDRDQIDVYVSTKAEAFSLPATPLVDADILVKDPSVH